MSRAVAEQHHPLQWPPFSAFAVRPALAPLSDQSGGLQCLLDPLVAQVDPVPFGQLVVEMRDVEPLVLFSVQPQYFLDRLPRTSGTRSYLALHGQVPSVKRPDNSRTKTTGQLTC